MAEKLLISGGIPRKLGELYKPGHVLKKAEMAIIDLVKQSYTPVLQYKTPQAYCSNTLPSIGFTGFTCHESYIYLPTGTEVLVLNSNNYKIEHIINDPLFNDIHHVTVGKTAIYITVTGMDAVFEYDFTYKRKHIHQVLGKPVFHRFSESQNLNKLTSTKPHEAHPNHVFFIDDEPWVTRLKQKDAVCLTDSTKKITITNGLPHDGFVKGNQVYFTTVNGYVEAFNTETLAKEGEIQLSGAPQRSGAPLGWCRGIYVSDSCFYIGFTQLRTTKITEHIAWARAMIKEKNYLPKPAPTRIEKYSHDGQFLTEYVLPAHGIFTIFGIQEVS